MTSRRAKPRRTRQSPEKTRRVLLDTAHELVNERGHREAVDIKVKDVVEAAGYTIGAAYQIWPSQRDFQEDVAVHISEHTDWADTTVIEDELDQILADGPDFDELVRRCSNVYVAHLLEREDFYTGLSFFAVRERRPELAAAIARGYDHVHEKFIEFYVTLLAAYGRRVRDGFTIDDLVVSSSAVGEGVALRHRIQPDVLRDDIALGPNGERWHVFGTCLMALIQHYTEEIPMTRSRADAFLLD